MINHSYISLTVPLDLEKSDAISWYKTVQETAPEGICVSTEIPPDNKSVRFYKKNTKGKTKYIVVLARNLSADEAAKIAKSWNDIYTAEMDFDIDWSQNPQIDSKSEQLKEDTLKAIALESSKRLHNQWTNEKISEGWRYSQKYSKINKTNPLLTSWENLSEKYKIVEYNRFLKLLEVLDEMDLTITKKV